MSHAIDRMRQELIKARILRNIAQPHRHSDIADMTGWRGRLLQSEPEIPDVPLHQRGFGVIDKDAT